MKESGKCISACAAGLILAWVCLAAGVAGADMQTWKDRLDDAYAIDLSGFIEARNGWRLQDDPHEKDVSIAEMRLQLEAGRDLGWGSFKLKGELLSDFVTDDYTALLREGNFLFSPLDAMDVKMGRQVLTWGTGDLLFINDLFPKDWKSFFIGRDDEYLKAPSDAVKASYFHELANMDLVFVPFFNASDHIDGERLSYWNPILGETAGQNFFLDTAERSSFGRDSEFALRLARNYGGTEVALYHNNGFWKTPEGINPATMQLIYPRLSVYGASARGQIWGGIANVEAGYYDSRQDQGGDDPMIRNSEIRFLAGFERELARDFTGALQYYVEWMEDYDAYMRSLPANAPARDEYRHLMTLRLTRLLMNQNLALSFFAYYSPSDKDCYLRPKVRYKIDDHWAIEAGGNFFYGSDNFTFFGQFQDNTNAYASLRWSF
ncbi:MAG: hypothetical protein MUO63_12855 [Desulfobulbaceae bacterium]|nr:hypothetical protein [Desulfobulbaceae bacterium]